MAEARSVLQLSQSDWKMRSGPSGIQMFNRVTGLNILVDEVRVPRAQWAASPRHVSIALTNTCDLNCPHCFAPRTPASLGIERLASWLHELDMNGCLGVGFGGGEPTLYQSLIELCRFATERTGMAVTLTTHAHGLDDRLVRSLAGNVHFVRVSMDGVGATYEALRGRSFAIFLRQLETVRSLAPFGINYLVNSHTLPDLDSAVKLAVDVGAVEFLLLPEQPVNGDKGIDARTTQALQRWVRGYSGNVPLTVSEHGAEGLPVCNPLPEECGVRVFAHIDASGVLKRSSFDDHGVRIGSTGIMGALEELRCKEVTL
jgi:MoaA/NifB/PqqE/SkfB family radical SAM enzyme